MKVVVCIKQVPDTKGGVQFKPDGTLDRGAMLAIMNPDDKAGLEAALRLKDLYGAEVIVLTAAATVWEVAHVSAPPSTRSVTRMALSAPIARAS